MTRKFLLGCLALLLAAMPAAGKDNHGDTKLSPDQRRELIRAFVAESVFVHRVFPMGTSGLRLDNGRVTPSDMEVRQMAAQMGVAAKPGDRVKITDVRFLSHAIVFEINGGPVKKKKWYQRLDVSAGGAVANAGGAGPVDQTKLYTNAQGSYVLLQFKDRIPPLTPDQVRSLLEPVFDFKAASVAEAFERAMPPKIADAIKNHHALVGMDRDMVQYAMGRPPRRYRDRDSNDNEYEEWIYGQPPEQVQFIRFVGDRVTRIEVMQVDGQKVVRTANEVGDLSDSMSAMAKDNQPKQEEQESTRQAPTLMRPGEAPARVQPSAPPSNVNNSLPPSMQPPQQQQQPQVPDASQGSIPNAPPR